MNKPRIKFLNWFSILCGVATLASAFFPISTLSREERLLASAVCLIVGCGYLIYDLIKQATRIFVIYGELHKRHQALSEQFDKKNRTLGDYETAFNHFGYVLVTALTPSKKAELAQVQNLYAVYLANLKNIKGE
jgi:hypothetical protein